MENYIKTNFDALLDFFSNRDAFNFADIKQRHRITPEQWYKESHSDANKYLEYLSKKNNYVTVNNQKGSMTRFYSIKGYSVLADAKLNNKH